MQRWLTNISAMQELCDENGIALYIQHLHIFCILHLFFQ